MIELVLVVALDVLTLSTNWYAHAERKTIEGDRVFCVCVWRYQTPPIYCLEVPLAAAPNVAPQASQGPKRRR